uniref:Solute carrier family 15 member 5 n=1 Tax=Serinus canaria TaxID=9135 RepID=A0A8C9MT23_SERCA
LSFFNWFHWLVNLNSAVVFVSISYIQQSVAKNLGFLIPFVSGLMAMITIHMVRGEMIYKPKTGKRHSLLTTFGVIFSALRTGCARHRYLCPAVPSWLDHAKENHGGHYSETQVEGTKSLARLFPLFTFQILYRTCVMQIPSGYYLQTMNSNLHFGGFVLPVAAMNVISIVPLLILVPILECINSWLFSSKDSAHSPTIYIGHLSAALSVVAAGFSEIHRKHFPQLEQTLSEELLLVSSMPCFHLAPQYILLGVAEALVTPSCSLLSFWLVPEGMRGISMHFLALFNGAGCFMGALIVQTAHAGTQGSWFPHLLHEGKLERFFFFLASLMLVNTLGFWAIAHRYDCTNGFRGSLPGERLLKHEKAIKHYNSVLESSPILSPLEKT